MHARPIRLLPRLFPAVVNQDTDETHRPFRKVNAARVRALARDIVAHHDDFHFAAVTISVEQQVRFSVLGNARTKQPVVGDLIIPLEAPLTIVDGIHRIFGLQRAMKEYPPLADECIAMLIHVDPNGTRRGQIFSDVKRHERSSAQSIRIGLDDRDETARLTRELIAAVPVFVDAIEMEKTAISNRSRKLFTLSALYQANKVLLADRKEESYETRLKLAIEFWAEVASHIPGWTEIVEGKTSAAEIRASYVHCHAIGIAAISRAGRALVKQFPKGWRRRLAELSTLDWSRSNKALWEGRAMIGGRLSKSSSAVARSGNAVKKHLGLNLSDDELAVEQ